MPQTVEALVQDIRLLGEDQFQVVQAVRALVTRTLGPVVEEVKYGGILFTSGVSFGGVFAYKGHVSVEFSQGAGIQDTLGFLECGGKGRRHIKLHSVDGCVDQEAGHVSAAGVGGGTKRKLRVSPTTHRQVAFCVYRRPAAGPRALSRATCQNCSTCTSAPRRR